MRKQSLIAPIRHVAVVLFAVVAAGPAAATTFLYDWDASVGTTGIAFSGDAGQLQSLSVSFDDVTSVLSFQSLFSPMGDGLLPDGGWLVLSDGPNPTGNGSEWAIYYLGRITGNLTAYVYDGSNGPKSWKKSPFLESFPGGTQASIDGAGSLTMGFAIDVSAINAAGIGPDWQGTRFADEVGIWFHPTTGTEAIYGDDGSLLSWKIQDDGFFDGVEGFATRQVPEPGVAVLAVLASAALLAAGRGASRR